MRIKQANGQFTGFLTVGSKWYMVTGCTSFEDCTAKLIEEAKK